MIKFLFAILLILNLYIFLTVGISSRNEIIRTVGQIPTHLGAVVEKVAMDIEQAKGG